MRYPFFQCQRCNLDISEMRLPITPKTKVPVCPECLRSDQVDVVLGDEETVVGDTEDAFSLDTVIFDDGR